MGSVVSSENEGPPTVHDRCVQCTHERRHHGGGVCIVCPAFTTDNRHAFTLEPQGSASSSLDEIHKWKNCWSCGHPEHSMKCRVGGALHHCGCLRLTPMDQIAATCRGVGGCLEHPADTETPEFCTHPEGEEGECPCAPSCSCCKVEPPPADAETAGDCETCGDPKGLHHADTGRCVVSGCNCPETAGEPECNGICLSAAEIGVPEAGNVVAYGHPDCPAHGNPEPEAPHEHDWSEWGAVYHGGHLRWRKCFGCIEVQSTPEGHFCPDCAPVCESPKGCHAPRACQESCAFGDQLRGIRMVPRPEPEPEAPECLHESWEERNPNPDSRGEIKISRWCNDCGDYLGRFAPTLPLNEVAMSIGPSTPPRRPPYAMEYVLEDGTSFEVALPGDATIRLDNGVLIVMHSQSPVKGLVQYRPMEVPQ